MKQSGVRGARKEEEEEEEEFEDEAEEEGNKREFEGAGLLCAMPLGSWPCVKTPP